MASTFRTARTRQKSKSKAKRKSKPAGRTTTRTLKNGRKVKHNVNVRPGWTADDYRDAHKTIPSEVYEVEKRDTQIVKRKYYGPLGRPPIGNKVMAYNRSKLNRTPHGIKADEKEMRNFKRNAYAPTQEEYLRQSRYAESYDDLMASEGYGMYDRIEEVEAELADRGYGDKRKRWKQMSNKNKNKALHEEAWREFNTHY